MIEEVYLQCGHGGEAVENFIRVSEHVAFVHLQCGHGGEAVENLTSPCTESPPMSAFNAATAVRPWRTGVEECCCRDRSAFNAATAVRPWRTERAPVVTGGWETLQCGHGGEAVENHEHDCTPRVGGLPSMRPRR